MQKVRSLISEAHKKAKTEVPDQGPMRKRNKKYDELMNDIDSLFPDPIPEPEPIPEPVEVVQPKIGILIYAKTLFS